MTNGEYTRIFLLRTLDTHEEAPQFVLSGNLRQVLGCTADQAMYCVRKELRKLIDEGGVVELRGGFVLRTFQ